MHRYNFDLNNAVGDVEHSFFVRHLPFSTRSVPLRVSVVSFGKHCILLAIIISVTVCFVIATGSTCSVDLARQLSQPLFLSEPNGTQERERVLTDGFLDNIHVEYSFHFQWPACSDRVRVDLVIKLSTRPFVKITLSALFYNIQN